MCPDRVSAYRLEHDVELLLSTTGGRKLFGFIPIRKPVKRLIQRELVNQLAREVLEGNVRKDSAIEADCSDGRVAKDRNTPVIQPAYVEELPLDERTLVRSLHDCGYSTMIAGKWHLGDTDPLQYGFDVNAGGYSAGNPKGGYFSPYNNPALPDGPAGEDLNIRLAHETIGFIDQKLEEGKPFFAYLSFYAVHGPIQTTKDKWDYFRQKAEGQGIADSGFAIDRTLPVRQRQDNPVYAGLISSMDDAIGMVLDELEAKGALDNTIIIFTADNGGVSSGDNYSTSCLPLRGGKGRRYGKSDQLGRVGRHG